VIQTIEQSFLALIVLVQNSLPNIRCPDYTEASEFPASQVD